MDWIASHWVELVIGLIGLLHVLPNDKVEAFGEKIVGRAFGWLTVRTSEWKAVKLVAFFWNTTAHFFIGVGRGLQKSIEKPGGAK